MKEIFHDEEREFHLVKAVKAIDRRRWDNELHLYLRHSR